MCVIRFSHIVTKGVVGKLDFSRERQREEEEEEEETNGGNDGHEATYIMVSSHSSSQSQCPLER